MRSKKIPFSWLQNAHLNPNQLEQRVHARYVIFPQDPLHIRIHGLLAGVVFHFTAAVALSNPAAHTTRADD